MFYFVTPVELRKHLGGILQSKLSEEMLTSADF